MNDYSACIVRGWRRATEDYLRLVPGTEQSRRATMKLAKDTCLSRGQLKFNSPLFRGGLFEALYAMDFGRSAPPGVAAAPAIAYPTVADPNPPAAAKVYPVLIAFADCVARADPAAARQLILSRVASASETTAFTSLMPRLRGCLPTGSELKFSRPMLRGYIAESLYRLSSAVAPDRLAANR